MSPNNKEEQGSVDTCLQKGSALTLGYGNGGMNPFMFTVPDGQGVDVCFFKLFVTTKPVDLGSISQSSPFSDLRTSRGESPGKSSSDFTGSWASISIPIVQRRAQPIVSNTSEEKKHENSANASTASFPIDSFAPQGFASSFNSPALNVSPDRHVHLPQWLSKGMQRLKVVLFPKRFTAAPCKVAVQPYEQERSCLWSSSRKKSNR
ncbi:hypothetical protein EDD18DRAFT_808757 [Armillaria luteobubalina]|uniref:Uncharacterized protein n=1 Tax=Armillaria luteobubalina TaxID=153913 RepID=A0AA39QBU1_9AGAR|nr:hypothetical protein EDD18DRAFT_808757 [Armillaria luteobubalina]